MDSGRPSGQCRQRLRSKTTASVKAEARLPGGLQDSMEVGGRMHVFHLLSALNPFSVLRKLMAMRWAF